MATNGLNPLPLLLKTSGTQLLEGAQSAARLPLPHSLSHGEFCSSGSKAVPVPRERSLPDRPSAGWGLPNIPDHWEPSESTFDVSHSKRCAHIHCFITPSPESSV